MQVKVHPCAAVFPLMSDVELDDLAKDITANRLQEPIVLWRDPAKPSRVFLLDGRNRIAALQRLGATITWRRDGGIIDRPRGVARFPDGTEEQIAALGREIPDPAAFVITRNIRRRHLTKQEQAELILRTIEAASIGTTTTTAATVPDSASDFSADLAENPAPPGRPKDPVLQAAVKEAEKHGISRRTVEAARASVRGKVVREARPTPPTSNAVVHAEPVPGYLKTRKRAERSNRFMTSTALDLDSLVELLATVSIEEIASLDSRLVPEWQASFTAAARALLRFAKRLEQERR